MSTLSKDLEKPISLTFYGHKYHFSGAKEIGAQLSVSLLTLSPGSHTHCLLALLTLLSATYRKDNSAFH